MSSPNADPRSPCPRRPVIRRQEFKFHEQLLQTQRAHLVDLWQAEVNAEKDIQVPRYEAAFQEWGASALALSL